MKSVVWISGLSFDWRCTHCYQQKFLHHTALDGSSYCHGRIKINCFEHRARDLIYLKLTCKWYNVDVEETEWMRVLQVYVRNRCFKKPIVYGLCAWNTLQKKTNMSDCSTSSRMFMRESACGYVCARMCVCVCVPYIYFSIVLQFFTHVWKMRGDKLKLKWIAE